MIAALAILVWGAGDVLADRTLRRALESEAEADYDAARELAARAADLAPARAQYLQAEARLHLRVGETSGTSTDFSSGVVTIERALDLIPRDLELAMDRADLLLSWGEVVGEPARIEEAAAQYEDILAIDPASSRAHLRVGVAYVELGRTEDAEDAWLTAASLSPRSAGPLVNLGILYEREGRVAAAREMLRRALELEPENAAARDALVRLEN
jgi:tetratricopeptide (TPR) repeat protein